MKRLTITPDIEARLKNSVGEVPKNIAVFEAVALTSLPVNKRGSIYDKAVHTAAFLGEMAAFLQTEGSFVPLHTLHAQGYEIPLGRVFYGAVFDNQGVAELSVQFYVSLDEQAKVYAERLDNGTINEVSVQILPKHLNCSQCGYDYLDEENRKNDPYAIYDRTCPNDHTVGVDGVHVLPNKLARFFEMSLVSLGAAQGTKIVPASRARLSADSEDLQRLAASGVAPEAIVLNASTKQSTKDQQQEERGQMSGIDPKDYALALSETIGLKKDVESKDKLIADKDKEIDGLKAQISVFEADKPKLEKVAALETENKTYVEFVAKQAKFAATALNLPETSVPAGVAEQIKFIEESGAKLHQLFPVGGRSENAPGDADKAVVAYSASFKINK